MLLSSLYISLGGMSTNCVNSLQMKIVSIYNCCLLIPPSASNDLSLTVLLADAGSDLRSLSVSLQRCFTLVDRGFTFKLISNYINMITATDSKVKTNFTGIEFRETALISKDASLIENPVRTIQ